MNKSKRGQVAVFIIVGVLIVGGALLYLLLRNGSQDKDIPLINEETDADAYLETCLQERVYETADILLEQGGYLDNEEVKTITYGFGEEGDPRQEVTYLCYTSEYDAPCVIQEGSIIKRMEIGLESELEEDVKYCLDELENAFENKGYYITRDFSEDEKIKFDLVEDELIIEINSTFVLTKAEETIIHNDFELEFDSKLYNLGKISGRILNDETRYATFDTLSYMNLYPNIEIQTRSTLDGSIIYLIEERDSQEKFLFAVRGGVEEHA